MVAPGPLVTAGQLAAELAGPGAPTVLDCRWTLAGGADRDGYGKGHLPGAVFVDLDRDLAAPPGAGGRHPLPAPEAFQAAMRRAGVRHDRPVVAYDQGEPGGAARAWWLLGWFGHPDARVLDGGLGAWVAAGLPLTTETADPDPGDFTARPGGRSCSTPPAPPAWPPPGCSWTPVPPPGTRASRNRSTRSPATSPAPATPPWPTSSATTAWSRRPACAGSSTATAPDPAPRSAPTGSGVVAAHVVLACEVAGIPASLYAGSWSDWVTDPSRPVATGPEP